MGDNVKTIPEGASVVIPRLFCKDAAAEIEFCTTALGAVELGRRPGPDGSVMHGLVTISGARLMIEAEIRALPSRAPQADGSSPEVSKGEFTRHILVIRQNDGSVHGYPIPDGELEEKKRKAAKHQKDEQ